MNAPIWNYKLFLCYVKIFHHDLTHAAQLRSTWSYPARKYLVLPWGILNNTTWPPHIAVQKDAVITILIYYLVDSK